MKYRNRFIVSDVETGGLCSKNQQSTIDVALTEIALLSIDNELLEIKDKASWLIKPYSDDLIYNPQAAAVSGITKELCEKEGIDIEEVYKNTVKFLKDNTYSKQKPILIFHNKPFDTPFVDNMFQLFNDSLFDYVDRIEDTLQWSRLKWTEKPNYKLGSVAEYLGVDLVDGHRALPDARITAKIWISFMKSLRDLNTPAQNIEESVEPTGRKGFKF